MMLKGLSTFFIILFWCSSIWAQMEYHNWYFGNKAAIGFDIDNKPSPLTDSEMRSTEGVASISDKDGNLLFYAHGHNAWNRDHDDMENGNGLLGGSGMAGGSGTQSTLIVPQPNSDSLYYIFTTTDIGDPVGYVHYSIVDMSLDGGLGAINATKNVQLQDNIGEKTTVARHCNKEDYWIISHGRNDANFYAWQLSASGLGTPIISNVGSIHDNASMNTSITGYMKVSPNNRLIALAVNDTGGPTPNTAKVGYLEVFDFDPSTGIVSNARHIPDVSRPYGVEFSPDHSRLYAGSIDGAIGELYQYDLLNNLGEPLTEEQIKLSEYVTHPGGGFGAMQLGPDSNIYVVSGFGSQFLGIITDPNGLGLDSYEEDAIDLLTGINYLGLPNYTKEVYIKASFEIADDTICAGESITFNNVSKNYPDSFIWHFGDGTTSTSKTPSHIYNDSGSYQVLLIVSSYCEPNDTAISNILVEAGIEVNASEDTTIYEGDTATLRIELGVGNNNVSWSPEQSLSCDSCLITKAFPQVTTTYYITSSYIGCSKTDSVTVTVSKEQICDFYLPNAIATNSPTNNKLSTNGNISTGVITIYDRFGKQVYKTNIEDKDYWNGIANNGELLPSGVYIYHIQSEVCSLITGNVTLIN